jgi:hypothetical protein
MPDRLAELRRQRALVQEHLAWLDREIAAAAPPAPPAAPMPPAPASGAAPAAPPPPAAGAADVDEIVAHYRSAPGAVREDVRKGCLLYFALALAVFAAGVAILYFTIGPR